MNDLVPVFEKSSAADLSVRSGVAGNVLHDYFSLHTESSRAVHRAILQRIAGHWGVLGQDGRIEDIEWWRVKAENFTELKRYWREQKVRAYEVRRYLSVLRGLSRMCFLKGLMDRDSYARIREISFLDRAEN